MRVTKILKWLFVITVMVSLTAVSAQAQFEVKKSVLRAGYSVSGFINMIDSNGTAKKTEPFDASWFNAGDTVRIAGRYKSPGGTSDTAYWKIKGFATDSVYRTIDSGKVISSAAGTDFYVNLAKRYNYQYWWVEIKPYTTNRNKGTLNWDIYTPRATVPNRRDISTGIE
jgi:hypothetical protein